MSKRQDRLERVVVRCQRKDDWGIDCVSSDIVLRLLRRERALLKRKVKGLPTVETTDFRKKILSVWVKLDDVIRVMEE